METIRVTAQHTQVQVDFRGCVDADRARHSAELYLAMAFRVKPRKDLCKTRFPINFAINFALTLRFYVDS